MSSTQPPRFPGRRTVEPLLLVVLTLALAAPAAAAPPRISVARVKGDPSGAVGAQLAAALCGAHRCVPGLAGVSRAQLARARKKGVEAAVLASIRRGGRGNVSVTLVSATGKTLQTWQLPLGRGRKIPAHRLDALAEDVRFILRPDSRSLASTAPAPRPARASPPIASAALPQREQVLDDEPGLRSSRAWPEPEPPPAEELPDVRVVTVPRVRTEEPDASMPWGSPARREPPATQDGDGFLQRFAADAIVETARHALVFPSTGTAPVGYSVNLYAVPRLRLEGHVLGEVMEELADVGFFCEVAYLPGLNVPSDARTLRVAYLRARGGALWRWELESGLVLRPAVAWEAERLSVRVDGGARFPGVPDTALSGPSLGLDLALPFRTTAFTLVAGSRAIWWLAAGELSGGARYFPGGRAVGLEVEAGATMRINRTFALGALGTHATTLWWLAPDRSGAYTVSSARASTWGARVWVRLEL